MKKPASNEAGHHIHIVLKIMLLAYGGERNRILLNQHPSAQGLRVQELLT